MSQPVQYRLLTSGEKKDQPMGYQPQARPSQAYSGPFSALVKSTPLPSEQEKRAKEVFSSAFAKKQGGKKRRTSKSTRKSRGRRLSKTRKYRH